MIYEINHLGHEILFWPINSVRTLWLASDNFLFIDGKLVSKSVGCCFHSEAKSTFQSDDCQTPIQMKTRTSGKGGIDYELHIDEKLVDRGNLQCSYMFKIPYDIEHVAAQIIKKPWLVYHGNIPNDEPSKKSKLHYLLRLTIFFVFYSAFMLITEFYGFKLAILFLILSIVGICTRRYLVRRRFLKSLNSKNKTSS